MMTEAEQHELDYKSRSTRLKFLMQMFLGLGGATVFGLVAAVAKAAIDASSLAAVGTAMATSWPILAGIAVIGLGSLYLGSRFMAENISNDQIHQAQRIGKETRGPGQTIETTLNPTTPVVSAITKDDEKDTAMDDAEGKWANRVTSQRSAVPDAPATSATSQNWAEKARPSATSQNAALGA